MLQDYFAPAKAVEDALRREMGGDVDEICSLFTVNDPEHLKQCAISLHITQLPSEFGGDADNGRRQQETQRYQVALCFKSPRTDSETERMRENAGRLILKLRRTLQGLKVVGDNTRVADVMVLKATANQPVITDDCRFRIFSFTFACKCVV